MPNFFLIFSLAFSASGIPSLGVLRVGRVKRLYLKLDYILSPSSRPQYYGNDRTDLIRLVSTKFGQTHWTITLVLAKLILFWKESRWKRMRRSGDSNTSQDRQNVFIHVVSFCEIVSWQQKYVKTHPKTSSECYDPMFCHNVAICLNLKYFHIASHLDWDFDNYRTFLRLSFCK